MDNLVLAAFGLMVVAMLGYAIKRSLSQHTIVPGYLLLIDQRSEQYMCEHIAHVRFIELVADALVIGQPRSIVLIHNGKTIGAYQG